LVTFPPIAHRHTPEKCCFSPLAGIRSCNTQIFHFSVFLVIFVSVPLRGFGLATCLVYLLSNPIQRIVSVPLRGFGLATTFGLIVFSMDLESFSPLAGIRSCNDNLDEVAKDVSDLCFSPLAGIRSCNVTLFKGRYQISQWLIMFQSPCGDSVLQPSSQEGLLSLGFRPQFHGGRFLPPKTRAKA
jgi:hypothetical protein